MLPKGKVKREKVKVENLPSYHKGGATGNCKIENCTERSQFLHRVRWLTRGRYGFLKRRRGERQKHQNCKEYTQSQC